MSARLFLRPGRQDHRVVGDLLAPNVSSHSISETLGGIVVDATIADARPQLAESAAGVGVPALVDPMTFLVQDEVDDGSAFARLPYGHLAGTSPDQVDLSAFIDAVLEFEVDHDATTLVAPYFHVNAADSPWASSNLELVRRTAERCEALGVKLPAVIVLSGNRQFLDSPVGRSYIERFIGEAEQAGASALAVCISPAGQPADSYSSIYKVTRIMASVQEGVLPVIGWRQGVYGPTIAALGAAGYETGFGAGEYSDVAGIQGRSRPQDASRPEREPRGSAFVYFPQLGRSIKRSAARILLTDPSIQGELACDLPGCCHSVQDTLEQWRPHAARTRLAQLQEMGAQPRRWRVNHLLQQVEIGQGTARRANEILAKNNDVQYLVPEKNLQALGEVLRFIAGAENH